MRFRDPVTGFVYPDEWVSACRDPDALGLARTGRAVLTSSGRVLMRGFTTGTTAAAACKAAILSLKGEINSVRVTVPAGLTIDIPVSGRDGRAVCHKYAGDYPGDVTAGIGFVAEYQPCDGGISLVAGEGIGRFSRTTPRYAKDDPAISPPARDSILRSIEEAIETCGLDGARIFLSVPDGECIAEKTLNPVIGITGGISVLGTTGLVEPWDDHMCEAVMERVSGSERMVLTTGRIGMQYSRMLFPDHDVILVGGKIKEALSHASGEVVLCGLPGLVLRYADPGILDGTGYVTVEELCTDPSFGDRLTRAVSLFHTRHPGVRVVIFDRTGTVLGDFQ
jgi:cobalt-precorrin-5B (C1)-methyltransferase